MCIKSLFKPDYSTWGCRWPEGHLAAQVHDRKHLARAPAYHNAFTPKPHLLRLRHVRHNNEHNVHTPKCVGENWGTLEKPTQNWEGEKSRAAHTGNWFFSSCYKMILNEVTHDRLHLSFNMLPVTLQAPHKFFISCYLTLLAQLKHPGSWQRQTSLSYCLSPPCSREIRTGVRVDGSVLLLFPGMLVSLSDHTTFSIF